MGISTEAKGSPPKAEKKTREYKHLPMFENLDPNAPHFADYFEIHINEIKHVQEILQVKLSDNPMRLEDQIKEAEAHYARMTSILAWAESYLDLAQRERLVPRDSDYTDVDRKIELDSACHRERRFRDIVSGLIRSIDTRVSLGQSLLKTYDAEKRQGT